MRRGFNSNSINQQEKNKSSANLKHKESAIGIMTNENQRMITSTVNNQTNFNLEEMIEYIRGNPEVAFGIHQHLTQGAMPSLIDDCFEVSTSQTPKRNLDNSDNDARPTSKQRRIVANEKQKNSAQENDSMATNIAQGLNNKPPQCLLTASKHQQHRFPFDQLKRAVSSNLPCFLIEYDQSINLNNRPSDISAAKIIESKFKQQGISVSFSLVGHMGNKLKLGVNNTESYATLISTDKWPSQINDIKIIVNKPKFTLGAFALVVRYVPLQYDDEYVKEEIERNLQSVGNIRRINYRFQRRTNDFRFTVNDLQEYNTLLKLGRVSIGNSFCSITPFLSGNRMTYCTRCWCLGHMRDKCVADHPRCRICLENLIEGQTHQCSNSFRCAQCGGDHHSLSSNCGKVVEHRTALKEQVNNAISGGKLQRFVPQDHPKPEQYYYTQKEFPSLPTLPSHATPWGLSSAQPLATVNTNGSEDSTKMLLTINQNILDMKETTHRMGEKLDRIDKKIDQTALDTELHHNTLLKLVPTLGSLVSEFIWPMMMLNVAGLKERQPKLQALFNDLNKLLLNLNLDYTARRKRSSSPLPHFNPSQQPSILPDNTPNMEADQNMSK